MSPEIVEAAARALRDIPASNSGYISAAPETLENVLSSGLIRKIADTASIAAEPLIRQQARAEAFEEAAKVAEGWLWSASSPIRIQNGIAASLRALANPTQPTAQGGEK